MLQFNSPWVLLSLFLLPVLYWLEKRKKTSASMRFSSLSLVNSCGSGWRVKWLPVVKVIRYLCLACLIIALARPREGISISNMSTKGVAMELVVDRSGSMGQQMEYEGEQLDRLETAKRVIADFVNGKNGQFQGRQGDLIGLVTFARYPDTVCPLVSSHNLLVDFLKQTRTASSQDEDGTAIGEAIALAVARLDKAEQQILENNRKIRQQVGAAFEPTFSIKTKAVILLTDGINNMGDIDPLQAAKLAKDLNIKIYTIGIGSDKDHMIWNGMRIPSREQLDEGLLREIADMTGGLYQKASDSKSLTDIYSKIDKLEKTEIKSIAYYDYKEKFAPWAIAALILIVLEILVKTTIFRKLP